MRKGQKELLENKEKRLAKIIGSKRTAEQKKKILNSHKENCKCFRCSIAPLPSD